MASTINWTEILNGNWAKDDVKDFVKGQISRDLMIELYPELRSVIRSKGVNSVRQAAHKALRRRKLV
jgi:hypothetical protein